MDRAVPYILVGLLAIALVVVIGAVAIKGVTNLASDDGYVPEGEPWEPTPGPDPAFVYASPSRAPMPRPLYLDRRLPLTAGELRDPRYEGPPAGLVRGRLAIGDRATQDELAESLRSTARSGAAPSELGAFFDPLLGGIDTPEHCAWLRRVLEGDPDVPLARSFWDALLWCDDPATAAFFERDDVPAETLVTWWEAHQHDGGPVPADALVEAVTEVARRGHLGSAARGTRIVAKAAPGRIDDLRERARRLPRDARQAVEDALPAHPAPVTTPLDDLVQSPAVDLDLLAASTDEPDRLARALVRCAVPTGEEQRAVDEARAADCLRVLAGTSQPMAVQAARAVRRWGVEMPYLRETVYAILDVGTPAVVGSHLADRGLLSTLLPDHATGEPAVAARDVLEAHDRALCFPTDTGRSPVDYTELLVQLAHLSRPVLRELVFDTVPPGGSTYDYRLDAYTTTARHSVFAYDQGTTYDVTTVLGLLNALARDRGSDVRYALLTSPDWSTTCVVAGPEQALLSAEREGLITLAEP